MKTLKTFAGWTGNLGEYLQPGDFVDEEMYRYFVNVMPPATFSDRVVQIGEPVSHVNGRPTFATLQRTPDGWRYCGNCYRGETREPAAAAGARA